MTGDRAFEFLPPEEVLWGCEHQSTLRFACPTCNESLRAELTTTRQERDALRTESEVRGLRAAEQLIYRKMLEHDTVSLLPDSLTTAWQSILAEIERLKGDAK